MSDKKIDVEYIANLSRLTLKKSETAGFTKQLGGIISYIEKLNEVDTDKTPPTTHPMPLKNVFREDRVRESLAADKAVANAPDKKDSFFKVPRVVDDGN